MKGLRVAKTTSETNVRLDRLEGDVSVLKADVSVLKTDVKDLKEEVHRQGILREADSTVLRRTLDAVLHIQEQTFSTKEIKNTLDRHEDRICALESVVKVRP